VYLIHFAWPLEEPDPAATRSRASHYLGTIYDLHARLRQHGAGQGAAIMRAVRDQGIPWFVARTWVGGRALERALKRRHNNPSLCPACRIAQNRVSDEGARGRLVDYRRTGRDRVVQGTTSSQTQALNRESATESWAAPF
jgi:hypothetical protein